MHRPRQRKAAVTAGAASIRPDLALMSCVRFRADPARSVCFRERTAGVRPNRNRTMQLITSAQRQKLLENGRAQRAALDQKEGAINFEPVVKLFTPDGNATWLLTALDPSGEYLAFGLCDLGLGEPELGYVSLHELAAARGSLGLPIERDLYFAPTRTSAAYAELAASIGASSPDGSSGASAARRPTLNCRSLE
jgi:hypothetical protein